MTVSIIICTRNRAEHLRKTLESLAKVEVPTDYTCELLVVDNGSTDHTREVVETCGVSNMPVRYILESRKGQAIARNTGMAHSQGEIILFTDDDVRHPKNWIAGMCQPIVSGKADLVAGGIKIPEHLERPWMTSVHRAWLASTDRIRSDDPKEAVGANMAFARRVLDMVHGFDPMLGPGALGYGDDTLFVWQLREAKCRIAAAPNVVLEHHYDEQRLSRASWLSAAKNHGKTFAYIKYHWLHEKSNSPYRDLLIAGLRLLYRRFRHWRDCLAREGCAEWEMMRVTGLYFALQTIVERRYPHRYTKRGTRRTGL